MQEASDIFKLSEQRNLSLVMDFYELTMAQCYFNSNKHEQIACFDLFYRKNPDDGGYAVFAGLEEIIGYIVNLKFEPEDIAYLSSLEMFSSEFLQYLKEFKFNGDLDAVLEGTPVFPGEPLVRVTAKMIDAQLIETALLLCVNHQSLIATKARRIVKSAQGRAIMEFGARRAHNFDSAIYGARAAYIGGVYGTATTYAAKKYNMPVLGTMAHSFVQAFDSEYEAFLTYAQTYPQQTTLLLDTYDTINSGLENAIKVAKNYLIPNGYKLAGVRIDSGDMAYLSKKIRQRLDEVGLNDTAIVVSNSLDEYLIQSLIAQGAQIQSLGVGENLVCSKSTPVFGGVYKLCAIEKNGEMVPRIKISENIEKVTNPGMKELYRIYDQKTNKAIADYLTLCNEKLDINSDLLVYHPMNHWKHKRIEKGTYYIKKMLKPIFKKGVLVYELPKLNEIRDYSISAFETIWDEVLRFEYPQTYYVDLSENLLSVKLKMLEEMKNVEK